MLLIFISCMSTFVKVFRLDMLGLGVNAQKLVPCSSNRTAVRFIRARWERPYLKDLYHRRVLLGADPEIHRSAFPNW